MVRSDPAGSKDNALVFAAADGSKLTELVITGRNNGHHARLHLTDEDMAKLIESAAVILAARAWQGVYERQRRAVKAA